MARTLGEAQEMIRAFDDANAFLGVAFNRRVLPPLRTATQMARDGELGQLFHVECIWTSWTAQGDCGWRDSAACLGGVFQDHGSHTIDLAQQWLGPACAVSAQAIGVGPQLGVDREVEDHMSALVEHAQGCSSVHVHSRASHRPVSELYRLYGTDATLELEYTGDWAYLAPDKWEMRLYRHGRALPFRLESRRPAADPQPGLSDGQYAFYAELTHFCNAVRSRRRGQCATGEEGAQVVRVIGAAYLSAIRGTTVSVEDGIEFTEEEYGKLRARIGR